jgi:hypothetical protein
VTEIGGLVAVFVLLSGTLVALYCVIVLPLSVGAVKPTDTAVSLVGVATIFEGAAGGAGMANRIDPLVVHL